MRVPQSGAEIESADRRHCSVPRDLIQAWVAIKRDAEGRSRCRSPDGFGWQRPPPEMASRYGQSGPEGVTYQRHSIIKHDRFSPAIRCAKVSLLIFMQLLDQRPIALLVASALLAVYCWVESARQLHRSAQPAENAPPSELQSANWTLMFTPEALAQGVDLSLGGFDMPRRGLASSVAASPPSSHDAAWLAGPSSAYWAKAETTCASDSKPTDCLLDLTSPNCRVR